MRTITIFGLIIFTFFQTFSQDSAYTLLHVNVIDIKTGKTSKDINVKISGNKIAAISRSQETCKNCRTIDATGKYLVPGLWDMHVHIRGMESLFFQLLIINGVTGIRDMHNPKRCYNAGQWRDSINNAGGIAPRIGAVAGCIVDGPGDGRNYGFLVARTADQGRLIVDSLKNSGVDFIKVYEHLTPIVYNAIAEESKKQHIPFSGHIPQAMDPVDCAAAGQKSFEHLEGFPRYWSSSKDEILRFYTDSFFIASDNDFDRIGGLKLNFDPDLATSLCKKLAGFGTYVDPTLVIDLPGNIKKELEQKKILAQKDIPPAIDAWFSGKDLMTGEDPYFSAIFQREWNFIAYLNKAKVPLMTGTDMSAIHRPVPGYSLHDELELLVAGGLTPLQALQAATINAATFLNREDEMGCIEKGKFADLVLLDANPLDDIKNTNKIFAVITNGKYLDTPALKDLKLKAIKSVPSPGAGK